MKEDDEHTNDDIVEGLVGNLIKLNDGHARNSWRIGKGILWPCGELLTSYIVRFVEGWGANHRELPVITSRWEKLRVRCLGSTFFCHLLDMRRHAGPRRQGEDRGGFCSAVIKEGMEYKAGSSLNRVLSDASIRVVAVFLLCAPP